MTMTTASPRLMRKLLIDSTTVSVCCAMTPSSMPSGRCVSSSPSRASTPAPMTTTLPPATVEIPRPIAA